MCREHTHTLACTGGHRSMTIDPLHLFEYYRMQACQHRYATVSSEFYFSNSRNRPVLKPKIITIILWWGEE